MKRIPLIFPAFAVMFLMISVAAFAQRGRGMGGPPMGNPSMGGPSMGRGNGPAMAPRDTARPSMDHQRMDSKQPAEMLAQNSKLDSKLQSLMPAGTNVQNAAKGFKNLGQFVAAVHVSHNLNIPFDQLKARMTGSNSESLGKAIKDLRPATDAKAQAKKAEKQAKSDLNS